MTQINIDWAGIAVERVSGMTLDAYFKKNIFEPLDIKNFSFFPSQHMRENLVSCQQRETDGTTDDIDHPFRRAVLHADKPAGKIMCAGGAGCFAQPAEYCQVLATLLNDGESPATGKRILKKETVETMFENQIKEFPDFGRRPTAAAKPRWTNPIPEFYPQDGKSIYYTSITPDVSRLSVAIRQPSPRMGLDVHADHSTRRDWSWREYSLVRAIRKILGDRTADMSTGGPASSTCSGGVTVKRASRES